MLCPVVVGGKSKLSLPVPLYRRSAKRIFGLFLTGASDESTLSSAVAGDKSTLSPPAPP